MKVEFLLVSPLFERIVQPYAANLDQLGIKSSSAWSNSAQYTRRLNGSTTTSWSAISPSRICPATSSAISGARKRRDREGSTNLIGVKSPAIDKLIDHVIFAKDRAELVAATNALDRALQWNELVVPQWYSPNVRIAYWNRYGQPKSTAGADARLLAGLVVRPDARQPSCRRSSKL